MSTTASKLKAILLAISCVVPYVGVLPSVAIVLFAALGRISGRLWLLLPAALGLTLSGGLLAIRPPPPDDQRGGELRGRIVHRDLGELSAALEKHRRREGRYPPELREVELMGRARPDPLASFGRAGLAIEYVYELSSDGSQYRLFSAGEDGQPNTGDDIYLDDALRATGDRE